MIKVSVIVPVYKVAKFLPKCLESLCAQTLKDIEIICVDDGFPDESPAILDEWAKKDKRIHVIHQENQGLSAARNAGLKIAKGFYIGFADSDDWLAEDYYELLYKKAVKNGADIACGYAVFWDKRNKRSKHEFVNAFAYLYPKNILESPLEKQGVIFSATVWGKIYRRESLSGIFFPVGMRYEDFYFNFLAVALANKIILTPRAHYYYRQHQNSAMALTRQTRLFFDIFKIVVLIRKALENLPLTRREQGTYQEQLTAFQIWNMGVVVRNLEPALQQEYYDLLKKAFQGLTLENNPYISPFLEQMWLLVVHSKNLSDIARQERPLKIFGIPLMKKVILWGDEVRYCIGKICLLKIKFQPWRTKYKVLGIPVGQKKSFLKQRVLPVLK